MPKPTPDPVKFDKKVYWDRRKKGYHGTVHPLGSKEQRYDNRKMIKNMQADQRKALKGGKK